MLRILALIGYEYINYNWPSQTKTLMIISVRPCNCLLNQFALYIHPHFNCPLDMLFELVNWAEVRCPPVEKGIHGLSEIISAYWEIVQTDRFPHVHDNDTHYSSCKQFPLLSWSIRAHVEAWASFPSHD